MRVFAKMTGLVLLLLTSSCFHIRVETGWDPRADFSARQTYAWRSDADLGGDPRLDNPQMEAQIRQEVETALAAKGFVKTSGPTPGFLIAYGGSVGRGASTVSRSTAKDANSQDWQWTYDTGSLALLQERGWTGSHSTDWEEGSLALVITDPATEQLLWRGVASGVIKGSASAAERRERITGALRDMLDDFPPKP